MAGAASFALIAYASAYLRYFLTPQGRVAIPPAPLFPYYNFGDPRL